jgi:hypothetical protein
MQRNTSRTWVAGLGFVLALIVALPASAQSSYAAVDLTPSGYGLARAMGGGVAAGYTSGTATAIPGRAAVWTGASLLDFHPALLDDPANNLVGRSAINGFLGDLQVGWGAGSSTSYHATAMLWRGTPASAALLSVPFAAWSSQAVKTDGVQIVGFATPFTKDGTTIGPVRAMVWDAATGTAVDLGDGGNGAEALDVARGLQVGYVMRNAPNAAIWNGSAKSLIVVHPKNAVGSRIDGTDGLRQVGWASYQVRVRTEAPRGNKDVLRAYATVWTGGNINTAAIIHPYPVNNTTINFTQSFATAVSGPTIVGYAVDESVGIGTPAYFHAIVWDASFRALDLNAYLPAGFVGSQAFSVDELGNIAGVMTAADGSRHAVQWVPVP